MSSRNLIGFFLAQRVHWPKVFTLILLTLNLFILSYGLQEDEGFSDIDGVEEYSEPEEPKGGNTTATTPKENNFGGSTNIIELSKWVNERLEKIEKETAFLSQRLEKLEQNSGASRSDELAAMLNNPVAEVFSGKNYTGKSEYYHYENSTYGGGCHDLRKVPGRVESVKTFGKCVRVFRGSKCMSLSLAVYPGSKNDHNILNSKLRRVKSIGPCLPDEFKNAYLRGTDVIKIGGDIRQYVPDLLEFFSWEKLRNSVEVSSPDLSVTHYRVGFKNRLEFIRARVMIDHLNISQPNFHMKNTEVFTSNLQKQENDIPGYAVPPSIGGPANETYNIFPESESAKKELAVLATRAQMFLRKKPDSRVAFTLVLLYEDDTKTRPYAFNYWIGYDRKNIDYGRFVN